MKPTRKNETDCAYLETAQFIFAHDIAKAKRATKRDRKISTKIRKVRA